MLFSSPLIIRVPFFPSAEEHSYSIHVSLGFGGPNRSLFTEHPSCSKRLSSQYIVGSYRVRERFVAAVPYPANISAAHYLLIHLTCQDAETAKVMRLATKKPATSTAAASGTVTSRTPKVYVQQIG